jgi:hypothetical protein
MAQTFALDEQLILQFFANLKALYIKVKKDEEKVMRLKMDYA